ncbi:MAG TPA: zinc ribbon domain-containing protein [Clostridia bacterium]|nr:zinc ribbon domain-containing protein [Clostridia bacterium]
MPLYLVENAHPAIIDAETYQRAMKRKEDNQKLSKRPEPKMDNQLFRRKIICSQCGRHFIRKNTNGTPGYVCSTYSAEGKDFCLSKKIPETTLIELSLSALAISEFDKELFDKEVNHIVARYPNELAFVFRDGHNCEYTWEDRSRAESWTEEMKKSAGDKTRSRKRSNSHGSHQESHED